MQVFCLEHRSYKAHDCNKANPNNRTVVICGECAASIERKEGEEEEEEEAILARHLKSGSCNPSNKIKPKCPVKRCKEVLTFSNTSICKTCKAKVCLKHRFPSDHGCSRVPAEATKFLDALVARNGNGCAHENGRGKLGTGSSTILIKS